MFETANLFSSAQSHKTHRQILFDPQHRSSARLNDPTQDPETRPADRLPKTAASSAHQTPEVQNSSVFVFNGMSSQATSSSHHVSLPHQRAQSRWRTDATLPDFPGYWDNSAAALPDLTTSDTTSNQPPAACTPIGLRSPAASSSRSDTRATGSAACEVTPTVRSPSASPPRAAKRKRGSSAAGEACSDRRCPTNRPARVATSATDAVHSPTKNRSDCRSRETQLQPVHHKEEKHAKGRLDNIRKDLQMASAHATAAKGGIGVAENNVHAVLEPSIFSDVFRIAVLEDADSDHGCLCAIQYDAQRADTTFESDQEALKQRLGERYRGDMMVTVAHILLTVPGKSNDAPRSYSVIRVIGMVGTSAEVWAATAGILESCELCFEVLERAKAWKHLACVLTAGSHPSTRGAYGPAGCICGPAKPEGCVCKGKDGWGYNRNGDLQVQPSLLSPGLFDANPTQELKTPTGNVEHMVEPVVQLYGMDIALEQTQSDTRRPPHAMTTHAGHDTAHTASMK
eukprot:m.97132 g.97132  ORF g.97132 m.97132 type:complete len:513 (+) comp16688_c0_seq2:700-2238(+)